MTDSRRFARECSREGCDKDAVDLWRPLCRLHGILSDARWLTDSELATVRERLADQTVLTPEQRRAHLVKARIRMVRTDAKYQRMGIDRALADGVTPEQIEEAQAEGAAEARSQSAGAFQTAADGFEQPQQ